MSNNNNSNNNLYSESLGAGPLHPFGAASNQHHHPQPQQQPPPQPHPLTGNPYLFPRANVRSNTPQPQLSTPTSPTKQQSFLWSRVHLSPESILPPPRSGAASVIVQGKLYMFGGYGGGTGRLDDLYSYDFATFTWKEIQVKSLERPGCRENNGVVISDNHTCIYLFGGYNGHCWLNDLWKFDIETLEWTCIQESSDPRPTEEDETNMAIGNAPQQQQQQQQQQQSDTSSTLAGAAIPGKIPSRRFGYVSVVHHNQLILFGGFDGTRWLNDMYVFDLEQQTWTQQIPVLGTALPSVRSCPAWAKDGNTLYIQGGYDGVERKDDFFACDLETFTWTKMPSMGNTPSPRYFHSCCMYGNKMYLYGGYSGSLRLADMYAYDFETNHWSEIDCNSNGDAPSGRSSLVAQVHGNHLFIFGGYNGRTVLNDFFKFRLRPIGVPPPALVNDMRRLLNDSETADVCFRVQDQLVYAHRAILAVRSEYFKVLLFNGHMRESVQAHKVASAPTSLSGASSTATTTSSGTAEDVSVPSEAIELSDVSHAVFVKVLEYLYTDTLEDVSLEVGIPLLIAGEQFLLERLKALCEDLLRREIHVDTAIHILVASHQHNALGLKEIVLDFILKNLTDDAIQAGLTQLRSEPDLLVEIIKLSSSSSSSRGAACFPPEEGMAPMLPSRSPSSGSVRQPQPPQPQGSYHFHPGYASMGGPLGRNPPSPPHQGGEASWRPHR